MESNNRSHCIRYALGEQNDVRFCHECDHNDSNDNDVISQNIKSDIKYQNNQANNKELCTICQLVKMRHRGSIFTCGNCMKWCHKFCLEKKSSTKSLDKDQNTYTCPSCADIKNSKQHNDSSCFSCNEEYDIIQDLLKLILELLGRFNVNIEKIMNIDYFDTNDNMTSETRETKQFVYLMILLKRLDASFKNMRSHLIRDEAQNQGEARLIGEITEKKGMKIC